SVHADVTTTTTAHLGGQVKALATNSESIGKRASTRRAPNYTERADIEYLVRDIYTRNGAPKSLLDSIKVTNLTATDLDGDGNYEVVAVQGGFDAYGYVIFKKVAGRWRQVYQGIGDAC